MVPKLLLYQSPNCVLISASITPKICISAPFANYPDQPPSQETLPDKTWGHSHHPLVTQLPTQPQGEPTGCRSALSLGLSAGLTWLLVAFEVLGGHSGPVLPDRWVQPSYLTTWISDWQNTRWHWPLTDWSDQRDFLLPFIHQEELVGTQFNTTFHPGSCYYQVGWGSLEVKGNSQFFINISIQGDT